MDWLHSGTSVEHNELFDLTGGNTSRNRAKVGMKTNSSSNFYWKISRLSSILYSRRGAGVRYKLEGSGFETREGQQIYIFSKSSRPTLRPTLPAIQ